MPSDGVEMAVSMIAAVIVAFFSVVAPDIMRFFGHGGNRTLLSATSQRSNHSFDDTDTTVPYSWRMFHGHLCTCDLRISTLHTCSRTRMGDPQGGKVGGL